MAKRLLLFVLLLCTWQAMAQENSPVSETSELKMAHPWAHRRVAYFGDSITDPTNDGSKKKYWNFLEEWLDIRPWVYGKSGRQWNDVGRQAEELQKEHGDEADAILIFIGTNDFNAAIPIGEWYEEAEEETMAAVHAPKAMTIRKKRTPVMDGNTYRGRINIALFNVKKMFPTKQVVLLTPLHRAYFYGGEQNIQPTEAYQNACGEYIDRYVESVKEAGNIWSVPVIDLNALSGLYPLMDEHVQLFHDGEKDRLHPNDNGHERLARTLYYQLLMLPCVF
ncbi:MAG: SGNH/GDSL hydrolase family protein [Prevotella sp.]|nr:SGNH/GDSL hydrolase family protein [Prevotella sp.]